MSQSVVQVMMRVTLATAGFLLLLRLPLFGFFFGFDFRAEFFFVGVFGFTVFVFVVDFFDRDPVFFACFRFALVGFGVAAVDERLCLGGGGQAGGVSGSCGGKQQQRGEQQDQQDREFPHGLCIGGRRGTP
jgi:hypothetical protein